MKGLSLSPPGRFASASLLHQRIVQRLELLLGIRWPLLCFDPRRINHIGDIPDYDAPTNGALEGLSQYCVVLSERLGRKLPTLDTALLARGGIVFLDVLCTKLVEI
jgi:hypothetical protein